jgi:hypothetical protein
MAPNSVHLHVPVKEGLGGSLVLRSHCHPTPFHFRWSISDKLYTTTSALAPPVVPQQFWSPGFHTLMYFPQWIGLASVTKRILWARFWQLTIVNNRLFYTMSGGISVLLSWGFSQVVTIAGRSTFQDQPVLIWCQAHFLATSPVFSSVLRMWCWLSPEWVIQDNKAAAQCFCDLVSWVTQQPFHYIYIFGTRVWILAYTLNHSFSPFLWWVFFKIGSHKLFAQAGFEPGSSWSLPPE